MWPQVVDLERSKGFSPLEGGKEEEGLERYCIPCSYKAGATASLTTIFPASLTRKVGWVERLVGL